ncbi:MAG TPA: ABC transporter ATP-binding protein, partial [Candidatus Limnocylindrales bacterium]
MLQLSGVSYRYAGYQNEVLHDVDLRLEDGEMVGLVGPNEAGKSTLCLVASGLAPASIGGSLRGALTIDGQPTAGLSTHQLAEQVVVGFQNPNTQRSGIAATVFEEIALGPMNLGLQVAETVERTREAIARLRLEAIIRRDPTRLSGGQSQLVAIASLLAMRPRHVILDEPTAQLDPAGTRLVGEALRSLAATGTSLLIAEHKTDLLDGLCSRILAIDGGRIVMDGSPAAVFDDPRLVEIG